jgi:glucose/arabinose dehydrogenase/cytochrome c2
MSHASPTRPAPVRHLFTLDRPGLLAALWLACGIVFVALLPPQLMQGQPLWQVQLSRLMLACLLAAPLFATPLADRQRDPSGDVRWIPALAVTAAAYVPALLCELLLTPGFPLPIVELSMAAGSFVVLVPLLVGRRHIGKAAIVAVVLAGALIGIGSAVADTREWTLGALAGRAKGPETIVQAVPTALHPLRVTSYRRFIDAKVAGGGIASLGAGNGYLVASGEGLLFHVTRDAPSGAFTATWLPATVPINHQQFFAETRQTGTSHAENNRVAMAPTWFRVADLLVEEQGGTITLFAVHNYWKSAEQCSVLRISTLRTPLQDLTRGVLAAHWNTLYETTPCQRLTNEGQGGRLVRLPDGALLLSVGVHDESNSPNAQNLASHYGKTIRIDALSGQAEVFTSGHRNPQGLTVASNGDVWQTEHGPRGGDELNRIVRGANFGWPEVSYGVPYFPNVPPKSGASGSHAGFVAPTYAWLPSIGVSNLIEVTSERFPHWKHDLVIASLVRTTLWRARVVDQRVTYVEEIKLDERLRDILQDEDGRLVLWTDRHSVIFVEPLTDESGGSPEDEQLLAALTASRCQACHVTTDASTHGIGPNLRGVIGRPVAGASGYAYSEGLRRAGGVWDVERLDRFLADPQRFAPGAKVEMQAVTDPAERRRALEFLRSVQ